MISEPRVHYLWSNFSACFVTSDVQFVNSTNISEKIGSTHHFLLSHTQKIWIKQTIVNFLEV